MLPIFNYLPISIYHLLFLSHILLVKLSKLSQTGNFNQKCGEYELPPRRRKIIFMIFFFVNSLEQSVYLSMLDANSKQLKHLIITAK